MRDTSTQDSATQDTAAQDAGALDPALLQLFVADPVADEHTHADATAFMRATVQRLQQARRRRTATRAVAALLAATSAAAWLGRSGMTAGADLVAMASAAGAQGLGALALGPQSLGEVLALPTVWAGAVVLLLGAHSLARALDRSGA